MRRIGQVFWITLAILLSIFTERSLAQEQVTLFGFVKAIDWNDDGDVIAVALVYDIQEENDEGDIETYTVEYLIEDDNIGGKLLEHDGETVEVTGNLSEDEAGSYYLKVKSFKLITNEDEDSPEENPEEPQE